MSAIKFERFDPQNPESVVMDVKDIVANAQLTADNIEAEEIDEKRKQLANEMEDLATMLSNVNERMVVLSLMLKLGIRMDRGKVLKGKELYKVLRDYLMEIGMNPEMVEHHVTLDEFVGSRFAVSMSGALGSVLGASASVPFGHKMEHSHSHSIGSAYGSQPEDDGMKLFGDLLRRGMMESGMDVEKLDEMRREIARLEAADKKIPF